MAVVKERVINLSISFYHEMNKLKKKTQTIFGKAKFAGHNCLEKNTQNQIQNKETPLLSK